MANRFVSPEQQFINSFGQPYAGGMLYFFVTGTSTPANTYQDVNLTTPNSNPVILDSAGNAGNIFLDPGVTYKAQLKDSSFNLIWSFDPVIPTDSQTSTGVTQLVPCTAAGTNSLVLTPIVSAQQPSSYSNYQIFSFVPVATTTGAVTASVGPLANLPVFVAPGIQAGSQTFLASDGPYLIAYGSLVDGGSTPGFLLINSNIQAIQNSIPIPEGEGYLTPVSGTPIISTDVIAATAIYYTPFKGLGNPIHNGISIIPYLLAGELALTLTSAQVANNIYDVFLAYNGGTPVIGTGPSWIAGSGGSINLGTCARGTGAGSTSLTRLQGIWTNAQTMSLTWNTGGGNETLSVPTNQGIYLGSIYVDTTAGQVTCHRTIGQNRKNGIWNNFNRQPIWLQVADPANNWTENTVVWHATHANGGNSITTFIGLAEAEILAGYEQVFNVSGSGSFVNSAAVSIGLNSSGVASGSIGNSVYASPSGVTGTTTVINQLKSTLVLLPVLGTNQLFAVANTGINATPTATTTYYGGQLMLLSATYLS